MILTPERMSSVRATFDKLVNTIIADTTETVEDRMQLLAKIEEQEQTIDRLTAELTKLDGQLATTTAELAVVNNCFDRIREVTAALPPVNGATVELPRPVEQPA